MQTRETSDMTSNDGARRLRTAHPKSLHRAVESRVSTWLRITLLVLGVAVFAWGLQYKLSLYKAPNHHAVSVAKLIQGEQANKRVILSSAHERCSDNALCQESRVVASDRPLGRQNRSRGKFLYLSTIFMPYCLFFRPPPSAS